MENLTSLEIAMLELINPINTTEFKQKFVTTEPFPHFCIDNFLDETFANEIYESFPTFQEAEKIGKGYTNVNEKRKIQITDSTKFAPAIKKLNNLLASEEFLNMWSDLTGVPNLISDLQLKGGGIHETNSGGHLDVHVDFNYIEETKLHRRLNILIYFNKDWQQDYGGYLDIWDSEVKKCYGSFEPKFNRACGFLTSEISFHGVTPLTCPSNIMRKSFATYFYTKEAPENWNGIKHSTIFKARPDEWAKGNILMPYEQTIKKTKSAFKDLKSFAKSKLKT